MPTEKVDPRQLWVGWTRDALSLYDAPEDADDEDLVDDAVAFASDYASAMLDEFEEVFGPVEGRTERQGPRGKRAKKTRSRRRDGDDGDG